MRKFLYILGGVCATIVVGLAILFAVVLWKGGPLDNESKNYASDAVIAITAHWNKQELLKRASPQLRDIIKAKPQGLDSMFDAGTTALGSLVEAQEPKGQATVNMTIATGTTISARYLVQARYQKGAATIDIVLLKIDGRWMIYGFHVNSDQFLQNLVGRPS